MKKTRGKTIKSGIRRRFLKHSIPRPLDLSNPRRGPGLFITLEGIDGCGKSTQAGRLVRRLSRLQVPAVLVREPGGSLLGETIREAILSSGRGVMAPRAELFLFLANRAQNVVEVVRPKMAEGRVIVCERFADSTIAYQGYGRGLNREKTAIMNDFAVGGCVPDLTLLFDLPAGEALARRRSGARGGRDRIESSGKAFYERVRRGFLAVAKQSPRRVRVIDASPPPDIVEAEVWKAVEIRLKRRRVRRKGGKRPRWTAGR